MPYSKDIRLGQGWFNTNINCFFDYLDGIETEITVLSENFTPKEVKYHDNTLNEEIELRLNEYISWKVFGASRQERTDIPECFSDAMPSDFDEDPYGYVYHHILILVEKHKYEGSTQGPWYRWRNTNDSSAEFE